VKRNPETSAETQLLIEKNVEDSVDSERTWWHKFALTLAVLTVIWNCCEAVASLYYGAETESVLLMAFGSDSFIEVISAFIVVLQIRNELNNKKKTSVECERWSAGGISVLLILLALSSVGGATYRLVMHQYPNTQIPALVITSVCLVGMYLLYVGKIRAAEHLQSATIMSDAKCSLGCLELSAVIFVGSLIFIIVQWAFNSECLWWLAPTMTYFVAYSVGKEGYYILKNVMSENFDGTITCCGECGPPQELHNVLAEEEV